MRRILVQESLGQTCLALLEDGKLAEYYVEHEGGATTTGNIYIGKVQNVLPGMQAAFVDIGFARNAFLYLADEEGEAPAPQVRPGESVVVQVVKEVQGDKGVRVSRQLTVPGHLCVLMPNNPYLTLSRRTVDVAERERLMQIAQRVHPPDMGLILRTAAQGMDEGSIAQEVKALCAQWAVTQKRIQSAQPPCCVRGESDLLSRAVRDMVGDDTQEIVVQGDGAMAQMRGQIAIVHPGKTFPMREHQGTEPLLEEAGLKEEIARLLQRKVWLKSGAYLVVDSTEALTVIDVNSGKFVGGKDLADTVFKVNLEAALEIARQLRLRDIGGIIIIDFIDMHEQAHRDELMRVLGKALGKDHNRTNLVGFTGLGLMEMTRKRLRHSFAQGMLRPCPHCHGTGDTLRPEEAARQALGDIQRRRASGEEQKLALYAQEDVAQAFAQLGAQEGVEIRPQKAQHSCTYRIQPLYGDAEREETT